jgi:hypothetical protein
VYPKSLQCEKNLQWLVSRADTLAYDKRTPLPQESFKNHLSPPQNKNPSPPFEWEEMGLQ